MSEEQLELIPSVKSKTVIVRTQATSQYGEAAVEILKSAGVKGMHVDDIVEQIASSSAILKDDKEIVKSKVNSYLYNKAVKSGKAIPNSEIKRVAGKKAGSFLRGVYKYYKKPESKEQRTHILSDTTNTTLFGTGGEYAVASEYLYKGYNVSRPAVDDGIDLIVFKDGIFSNIQVKTSSSIKERFQFSIKTKVFENKSSISTFYVLLCRRVMKTHYRNDYIVLPSTAIEFFVNQGYVNKSDSSISFGITINATDQAMLNGKHDTTMYLNRF